MIGIKYVAVAIVDTNTKDVFTGIFPHETSTIEVSLNGNNSKHFLSDIAAVAAARGWSIFLDFGTHLFNETFSLDGVGLHEVRDPVTLVRHLNKEQT